VPKAVVQTEAITYNLKSLPGGWVQLRPLTFGQLLKRREMASRMSAVSQGNKQPDKYTMEVILHQTNLFDFKHCIMDHNLFEDDDDLVKFNFADPKAFEKLDPRIGSEIEFEISKLNEPDTEADLEAFRSGSGENLGEIQTPDSNQISVAK